MNNFKKKNSEIFFISSARGLRIKLKPQAGAVGTSHSGPSGQLGRGFWPKQILTNKNFHAEGFLGSF